MYSNCSCATEASLLLNTSLSEPWWAYSSLPSPSVVQGQGQVTGAVEGYCPFDCDSVFTAMLAALTIMSVISSTGRVGNQLVSLRAVEPRDKAASLVIMVSALSVFVFLPSPIIFGAIIGIPEWAMLSKLQL